MWCTHVCVNVVWVNVVHVCKWGACVFVCMHVCAPVCVCVCVCELVHVCVYTGTHMGGCVIAVKHFVLLLTNGMQGPA